jgi:ergothioneine biosynthesis protein EgtB
MLNLNTAVEAHLNIASVPKLIVDLQKQFVQTREQTRSLMRGLSDEDCALQSMPDASPTKWHLGHTTWFFEVFVLEQHEPNHRPFNASFKVMFNSYYEAIGEKHPRPYRGMISRPGLADIIEYRHNVEDRVNQLFVGLDLESDQGKKISALVQLGIQHEQQHQELLLTDLKHLLSLNPLKPAYRDGWPLVTVGPMQTGWQEYTGGLSTVGRDPSESIFSFDNESPAHQVFLRPFALARAPIKNADVLAFMADGGYERHEFWLSMGWEWNQAQRQINQGAPRAPAYWQTSQSASPANFAASTAAYSNEWQTFTLRGLCPIALDVPATHLSYFEADAIARWSDARLPTEAEWEFAAKTMLTNQQSIAGNFVESAVYHPLALETHYSDLDHFWGDNWEWTQSQYNAYPGFVANPGAIGEYNGKFMCNQFVLRGGSCATPQSHIRATYRNFFPPQATWQFSGARLARDL